MSISTAEQWYALRVLPGKDKKTASYFDKVGLRHYLPVVRELHQWSDRKKWIERPVMSPYVFVYTDEKNRNKAFGAGTVLSYVCRDKKPAVISELELDTIKQLCLFGKDLRVEGPCIIPGDRVRITTGPLQGLEGIAIESEGKFKMHIMLDTLGCWASVHLDVRYLKGL